MDQRDTNDVLVTLPISAAFAARHVRSLKPGDDRQTDLSKRLSWLLRRGAKELGCASPDDSEGWFAIEDLVKLELFADVDVEELTEIAKASNTEKLRYDLREGRDGGHEICAVARASASVRAASAKKLTARVGEGDLSSGPRQLGVPRTRAHSSASSALRPPSSRRIEEGGSALPQRAFPAASWGWSPGGWWWNPQWPQRWEGGASCAWSARSASGRRRALSLRSARGRSSSQRWQPVSEPRHPEAKEQPGEQLSQPGEHQQEEEEQHEQEQQEKQQ
mmetsp:Transcript_59348/g.106718  ORF Transcript_59348/g.106718 Transcript_59348/m.106718 type:complete len:277 (+) Transcript_59348:75-905(+)